MIKESLDELMHHLKHFWVQLRDLKKINSATFLKLTQMFPFDLFLIYILNCKWVRCTTVFNCIDFVITKVIRTGSQRDWN